MEKMDMERMMEEKYRKVYSEELGRYVFVMRSWVEKSVFKRHKNLFGYTDIGWTVKHPKKLIRALVAEGVWNEGSKDERPNNTLERMSEDPEEYENMLGAAWRDRDNMQPGK